jgi:hypothetical protein
LLVESAQCRVSLSQGGSCRSPSLKESTTYFASHSIDDTTLHSLWRVPHRKDSTCTYHGCSNSATGGLRRCCGKGALTNHSCHCPLYCDFPGRIYRYGRLADRWQFCIFLLNVVFVAGTFRPDRIRSIADRFGVNGDMALENILYGMLASIFPRSCVTRK